MEIAGQNHNIKTGNKTPENGEKFKYLGMALTYQNYVHEEIKNKLILANAA